MKGNEDTPLLSRLHQCPSCSSKSRLLLCLHKLKNLTWWPNRPVMEIWVSVHHLFNVCLCAQKWVRFGRKRPEDQEGRQEALTRWADGRTKPSNEHTPHPILPVHVSPCSPPDSLGFDLYESSPPPAPRPRPQSVNAAARWSGGGGTAATPGKPGAAEWRDGAWAVRRGGRHTVFSLLDWQPRLGGQLKAAG